MKLMWEGHVMHMCIVYRQASLRENVPNILLCLSHTCKYILVQNSMAASPLPHCLLCQGMVPKFGAIKAV